MVLLNMHSGQRPIWPLSTLTVTELSQRNGTAKGLRLYLLLALFMTGLPHTALAGSLYVSLHGDDDASNPGTSIDRPLRSLCAAAARSKPGDDVFVRGGTDAEPWVYKQLVRIDTSGAPSAPIRYRPHESERVIIDGSESMNPSADLATCPSLAEERRNSRDNRLNLVVISGHYVEFSGFEVRHSARTGIVAWATHDTKISGNIVHDSYQGAIWIGHDALLGKAHNNAAEDNEVYRNGLINVNRDLDGGWPVAIQVSLSDVTTLKRNTVYNNYGEGLGALSSRSVTIEENRSFDNFSVLIYLDNTQDAQVQRNFAYITGDTSFYRKLPGDSHYSPADGIAVANEINSPYLPSRSGRVMNNIIVGTRVGFGYGNYPGSNRCPRVTCDFGGGMADFLVANNTVVNSTVAALKIDPPCPAAPTNPALRCTEQAIDPGSVNQVANNIFFRLTSGALANGTNVNVSSANNCWYDNDPTTDDSGVFGNPSDVLADPQLEDPGPLPSDPEGRRTVSPDRYRIPVGSPCASAGQTLSEVATDFDGAVRTVPYSVGAYNPEAARVEASPTHLLFEAFYLHHPHPQQTVTVLNRGKVKGILQMTIAGPFYIATSSCGGVLLPGASCAIDVRFSTAALGHQDGVLSPAPGVQVQLSGTTVSRYERYEFAVGLGTRGGRSATALGAAVGSLDTGILVHPGDRISISAGGLVWSGVWATGWTGPSGWHTWDEPACCGFPFYKRHIVPGSGDRAHPFSLLYRIGGAAIRYVGYGFRDRAHEGDDGSLVLFINSDNYRNGEGAYSIRVTVYRMAR